MRTTDRHGLTVIGLVLILVVLGIIITFLIRRTRDDADASDTARSDPAIAAPSAAAAPLVDRLELATPLDSTAASGDTIVLRIRAIGASAGVVGAHVQLEASGGGHVEPASATTNDIGEATARWVLGTAGPQRVRATVPGTAAPALTADVRLTSDAAAGAGR